MSTQKWLFVPEPFSEELLSSWLTRIAKANFTTAIGLFSQNWACKRFTNKDIDIFEYPDDFWQALAAHTGVSSERIHQMRLKSYEGYIQETVNGKGKQRWIVTSSHDIKYHHRERGLCYCPLCLKENAYYKKEWRLFFVNACLKHCCFLESQCPKCSAPIAPVYTQADQGMEFCFHCGASLSNMKPTMIPRYSGGLKTIKRLLNIAKRGYFLLDGKWHYSLSYFYILRIFARHISHASYWKMVVQNDGKKRRNFPEQFTARQMFGIIKRSVELFQNWPYQFREFFKNGELNNKPRIFEKYERKNNYKEVPFWFLMPLEECVEAVHPLCKEEVKSIKAYLFKKGELTAKKFADITGYHWNSGYRYMLK